MAIRTIREIGDPVLNKISKEVTAITPRIKDLIGDMCRACGAAGWNIKAHCGD